MKKCIIFPRVSTEALEHFLSALEQTLYKYGETHNLAETWTERLCKNYKEYYGKDLIIPRWFDIKSEYGL